MTMLAITKTDEIHGDRAHRIDAAGPRGVDHPTAGTRLRIVGESVEWRGVLRDATQVAATDTTVLITGEIGHRQGSRRSVHPCSVSAQELHMRIRKYRLEEAATA
jgi:transcriptional regulator with GAF, ATPase, and Fis domain